MSKILIEVDAAQLEKSLAQLKLNVQLRFFRVLEMSTRRARWEPFLAKIRKRSAKRPIPQRIIDQLCEQTRKELYAQSRR